MPAPRTWLRIHRAAIAAAYSITFNTANPHTRTDTNNYCNFAQQFTIHLTGGGGDGGDGGRGRGVEISISTRQFHYGMLAAAASNGYNNQLAKLLADFRRWHSPTQLSRFGNSIKCEINNNYNSASCSSETITRLPGNNAAPKAHARVSR